MESVEWNSRLCPHAHSCHLIPSCVISCHVSLQVASLNNLLACDSVSPAPEALSWPVKSELYDLYSVFIGQTDAESPTAARLRELLDIDESTAGSLETVVESGSFSLDILDPTAEEKFVF